MPYAPLLTAIKSECVCSAVPLVPAGALQESVEELYELHQGCNLVSETHGAAQDTDLQELLPFGEYVPQDLSGPATSALLGIEPWDMDRLLQRLALQNTATSSRRSRPRSRSRPYSMPGAPSGERATYRFLFLAPNAALQSITFLSSYFPGESNFSNASTSFLQRTYVLASM